MDLKININKIKESLLKKSFYLIILITYSDYWSNFIKLKKNRFP